MRLNPEQFRNIEGGRVAILGNGPSLNNWDLSKLDCDTIGINKSYLLIESKYYVTVAKDRAREVNEGKITAYKAVFTNRDALIDEDIKQPVVILPMTLADTYAKDASAGNYNFGYDLTKPIPRTFGGMAATQVALFLGYDRIFWIGIDGGTDNFTGKGRDPHRPDYHRKCFWHLWRWWANQNEVQIIQTNPYAIIDWFPNGDPPMVT